MEQKIIITGDSTCDLSPELCERYNIVKYPLVVTLGGEIYNDGVDITPQMIYDYNDKTGELPKTTAINIAEYSEFFKKYTDEGYTVIHFSLSGEFSSTYNNARIAAEEVGNVFVVDSRNLSSGSALLMLYAVDLIKSGKSAEETVEELNDVIPRVDASFVIDSLDYLYQGGRCSALSVLGANLLKLKPCIQVKDGKMGVYKKYRGKFDAILKEYVNERLSNPDDIDKTRVFVTHAGCDEKLMKELVKIVSDKNIFDEIFLSTAGSTICSHCGQFTMGILFIRNTPIN